MDCSKRLLQLTCLAMFCVYGHVGPKVAEGTPSMKYISGDALTNIDAKGPDGQPYPRALIDKLCLEGEFGGTRNTRRGRTLMPTLDPRTVQNKLMANYKTANSQNSRPEGRVIGPESFSGNMVIGGVSAEVRMSSAIKKGSPSKPLPSCKSEVPPRMCPTKYNTTAPMYGVSLTSGQPVTIVQKFPDLLQQVIFEVCQSDECDVVHGRCVQTYVPYLFLVIPLGPVTLTGQDYVLVESGCVCQPKYGNKDSIPSPLDVISGGPDGN